MIGKSKIIIAISGILVGLASVLVMYFSLMTTGVIGGNSDAYNLVFSTGSSEKTYDGETLTFEQYSLKEGELKEGHTFDVSFTGFQTEVGQSSNDMVVTIKNESGHDVTSKYKITYELGTLTVNSRKVELESLSATKEYDGKPLRCEEYIIKSGSIAEGQTLNLTFTGEITNYGKQSNTFYASIFSSNGSDVTKNYEIDYKYGELSITNQKVTIASKDAEKAYDGTPLTCHDYEIVSGTLIEGHTIQVSYLSEIINVGELSNDFEVRVYDKQNKDVTSYYDFTKVKGALKVIERDITITTGSKNEIYNGTAITCENYEITEGSLVSGHSFVPKYQSTITNVGTVENKITYSIYDKSKNDVTFNYNVTVVEGEIKVLAKPITVESESAKRNYDGTPLTNSNYNKEAVELIEGHSIEVTTIASITEVGKTNNTLVVVIKDEQGNDVTNNYEVNKIEGKLEVLARPITITSESDNKYYDGTPLTNSNFKYNTDELVEGHSIEVTTIASITEVGKTNNTILVIIKDEQGKDVTINYDINNLEGELEVLARPITISTQGDSKVYDGTPLTNSKYSIESEELIEGHKIEVKTIGTITDVGTIENQATVTIKDNKGNLVTNNYEITIVCGSLEVIARKILISTGSSKKYYDGTELVNNEYQIVSQDLLSGHQLDVSTFRSIVNVGIESNSAKATIKDEKGNDVSYNYDISVEEGTLEVLPRPITITSGTASKIYDGTELTCKEYEVTSTNNVLDSHSLVVEVTGSRTEPGENKNSVSSVTVLDESKLDISYNYEVTIILGTLTVKLPDGSTAGGAGGSSGGAGGSGGSGGSSGSNDNSSLSKEPFGDDNTIYMELSSDTTTSVYLKSNSYGNYTFGGWEKASDEIDYTNSPINPMYLSSAALLDNNQTENTITIQMLVEGMEFHIPYYTTNGPSSKNDYKFDYQYTNPYTLNFINYNFESSGSVMIQNTAYTSFEEEYYQYVLNNYLSLPETTKQAMLQIIKDNNIDANSSTIIADVAQYIQNAAVYNLKFAPFPNNVDMAIYFLTDAKEGICQHYATSAVVMYRTLGIPARYTVGFVGSTIANEKTQVSGKQAHAWVEIYIKGMGWVPVEVTGSGPNGGGANSGSGGAGGSGGDAKKKIAIKPIDVYKKYDGSTTYATQQVQGIGELLEKGYTYDVEIIGENSEIGIVKSIIKSFVLYDKNLNDVTQQFEFEYKNGIIHNYLYEISVFTDDNVKEYDGAYLTNNNWYYTGELSEGHFIDETSIAFTQTSKNVGEYVNKVEFGIYDSAGEEVTNLYKINENFGTLTITAKTITIISSSASKVFDGKVLKCNEFTLSQDSSLVEGDVATVTIIGYQKLPGKSENTIASVMINNSKDEDVTRNYIINIINGTLEVTLK